MKSESVYREGGDTCASCIELAQKLGKSTEMLQAAESKIARTKARNFFTFLPEAIGSSFLIGGSIMAISAIVGTCKADRIEMYAHCKDSAEIMNGTGFEKACLFKAVLSTEPLSPDRDGSPRVLVRCTCPGSQRNDEAPSAPPGAR